VHSIESTATPAPDVSAGSVDPTPREPLLSVRRLTTKYDDVVAVDDISFDVMSGEFFTLLGPSGCGKSTTLMSLAGFEAPETGEIWLAGRDVTRERPERRGMGVVFQSYALFPHMSVLENVLFPLKMRGVPREAARRKAAQALESVELASRLTEQRPAQLSGGQQQRVALARAMVFDPAILLMDEPLSALDRRLRQSLQFELRHLQARLATTVIYVTHDQEEALVLSDRIGVMRDGRFEQIATSREVYERPANAFVATFLGGSNRLTVSVAVRRPDGTADVTIAADPSIRLPATVGGDDLASDSVLLLVRPENVRIRDPRVSTDSFGLEGIVRDTAFLGDHVRVELEMLSSDIWTLRLRPGEGLGSAYSPGSRVVVCWDAGDARLIEPT
jgi:putative spermidine/putrescine transport system ATP-binding protein